MANATITTGHSEPSYLEYKDRFGGLLSWLLSVDHKKIGIMYMIVMFTFFLGAVALGFLMRLEMLTPGQTIVDPQTYNSMFTLHGVIMTFFFIVPGVPAIMGNFFLPIMIGAKDVAFPRVNLLSWYCYMTGAVLAVIALTSGNVPMDTGWTFYVPYSTLSLSAVSLPLAAAWMLGMSSILTGLNFVTTVHRMRAKGMTWFRLPLFIWALYSTAWIQVLATPVVGVTIILVILERSFGLPVFDPATGGDPVLMQHMFWIYSHPVVYVMVLPALGIISEALPTFCRKPIFGYKAIALSSLAIAFFGYMVWAHHMFTSGMSDFAKVVFSFLTYTVAIPSAIKVFAWLGTLYKASINFQVPFLWALFFIYNFTLGGLTGMFLGSLGTDIHLHDTYFIVAHFHFMMFGSAAFGIFTGLHYWWPKMFGKMYDKRMGFISATVMFVGFQLLYCPMFIMGYLGMPRRYYDYLPEFQPYHVLSTIGSWVLIAGILLVLYNLVESLFRGEDAPMNPWGGITFEWTVPSPPPLLNFDDDPVQENEAYDYDQLQEAKAEYQ